MIANDPKWSFDDNKKSAPAIMHLNYPPGEAVSCELHKKMAEQITPDDIDTAIDAERYIEACNLFESGN